MPERASERFARLVYSHIQAFPTDSYQRAHETVGAMHPALRAECEAETASEAASVAAANEAAAAAKQQAANARQARMSAVSSAVEDMMREHPHLEYAAAYNKVQREQPGLFAVLETPESRRAANEAAKKPKPWNLTDADRQPGATRPVRND